MNIKELFYEGVICASSANTGSIVVKVSQTANAPHKPTASLRYAKSE
ncbi:MAG: hypothetical protein FWD19_00195 [Defluviitaleaceae bacterium]|nr:hypothetical protein [Defluviitaleaceae bacterium]